MKEEIRTINISGFKEKKKKIMIKEQKAEISRLILEISLSEAKDRLYTFADLTKTLDVNCIHKDTPTGLSSMIFGIARIVDNLLEYVYDPKKVPPEIY